MRVNKNCSIALLMLLGLGLALGAGTSSAASDPVENAPGGQAERQPGQWSKPTVAHQGIRVMNAAGHRAESRYHYAPPGKMHEETTMEGMPLSIIVREDLGVIWTLLPGGMYVEMEIGEAGGQGAPSAEDIVEFQALGEEEVGGWPTTRYRVVSMEDGEPLEGEFWVTKHWIPVRMELQLGDGSGETVEWEIRELRITEQDPALFELPAGATPMPGAEALRGLFD